MDVIAASCNTYLEYSTSGDLFIYQCTIRQMRQLRFVHVSVFSVFSVDRFRRWPSEFGPVIGAHLRHCAARYLIFD